MSLHYKIAEKITTFLDFIYYNNLKQLYNNFIEISIIKPDIFVYLQYYLTYTFLYYITNNNLLLYSSSLHLIHINGIIFNNLCIKYNYIPIKNTYFLKDVNYSLFIYLFCLKLYFYKKIYLLINVLLFYIIYNINKIYKKRLECINTKKEFKHFLKIIIITPNKKTIENIIYITQIFSYSNFLLFINFLLYNMTI